MMALTEETDMMSVACFSVSDPVGNGVLSFCNSRKLTVAQPFDAPAEAINKFAANNQMINEVKSGLESISKLTENSRINLVSLRNFGIHRNSIMENVTIQSFIDRYCSHRNAS